MRIGFVRSVGRATGYRHRALQEIDDGITEHIITITRDHMTRSRDVDVFTVRAKLKEVLCAFLAQHVRQSAAHQQAWQGEVFGARDQAFGALVHVAP